MDQIRKLSMKEELTRKEEDKLEELLEELKVQSPIGREAAERRKILDELNNIRKKLENGNREK